MPALDGVRALAILAVLAAHAGIPGVPGGFIGVDVFFVLSGFLITSLLLDERIRTGQSDLAAFWARRARRLLPAALVMIVAVFLGRSLLSPDAMGGLRDDALSATLWSSNWRFALHGTDYFAQGGTASPLQHTWSLGVEEQFYLLWPLLLAVIWIDTRSREVRRRRLLLVATVGIAASVAVTYRLSHVAALGRVYFGTDTRAQELLVGALLAAVLQPTWKWHRSSHRSRRSPQVQDLPALAPIAAILGLGTLLVLAHIETGAQSEYRHGLMLGVSVASAMLIGAVVLDGRMAIAQALSSAPMVGLGRISYGVYLWHWPIFEVLTGARTGLRGYDLAGVRVALTLAVATASYFVIERPVQRWRVSPMRVLPAAAAAVACVLAIALYEVPGKPTIGTAAADVLPGTPVAVAAGQVHANEAAHRAPGHTSQITVDVFGDSIAWTLAQYFPATTTTTLVNHAALGCGVATVGPYRYFGTQYDENNACLSWPADWGKAMSTDHPQEALLIVGRWETMDRELDGVWTHVGEPDYDAYLSAQLDQAISVLGSSGARVVVATEPYNRRGEQPDGSLYPEDNPVRVDAWNQLLRQRVAAHSGVTLLDLNKKLCPDGHFTWDVEGVEVRSDGVHISPDGDAWLAPWLATQLQAART
jgi:peptidoglycan/LPS O-acetylase OafA/YrhL